MTISALLKIKNNINNLFKTALVLHRKRIFSISSHISIACTEECSKYVLLYCKSHIDDSVFKKRFSHIPKYKLKSAHYYLAGSLDIIYIIHMMKKYRKIQWTDEEFSMISEYLMMDIGWNNPEKLSELILSRLEDRDPGFSKIPLEYKMSDSDRQLRSKIAKESHYKTELHRLSSIYVDINDDGEAVSGPWIIDKEISLDYLRDAKLCRAVVHVLSMKELDIDSYFEMLPKKFKLEAEEKLKEMRSKFHLPE